MRATIYACTVQSGKHIYQIIDLHTTYYGYQIRLAVLPV